MIVLQAASGFGSLSLETSIPLALLGTVSIGSIILMLMQATKQLWPTLEGQWAIRVTFLYSMLAVALAMRQLGADLWAADTLIAVFFGGCGAFVAAVSQYAFLFKRSVEGLPPPPDAEAPAEAFVDDAEPMTAAQTQRVTTTLAGERLSDRVHEHLGRARAEAAP